MGFARNRTRSVAVHAFQFIAWASLLIKMEPIVGQADPRPTPSPLDSQFQAAMAARDQGDLDRAKSILISLRRDHPGQFALDESLGLIYVAQEQYAEALPLLQAAVREEPSSDVAHSNLGADLFKLKRNREALDEFTVAARLNPKNPTTQQSLGEAWLDAGKPERAAEAFSKALEGNPDDPALETALATACIAAGDFDRALAILTKVPDADSSADVQVLFGQSEEGKGNPLEAARHFNRAVQLDPTESNVWMLGVEFLRHWTFDSAVTQFEAAVMRFPTSTRMKLGLGAAYFGAGKYGASIPVFGALLENDKDSVLYAELLGMACNAVTEADKQKCSALLTYAEDHPRDAKASTYAASMLLTETTSDRKTERARRLLNNALDADPKSANAQYQMGLLKQNEGNWTGSVTNLETAIRLKPDLASAHYRLALAYWRTGRKQDAQNQMELQKQYSQQQQQDLDRRLREITVFVVDEKK